jgi:2-dehydro-3-deoxyphosphogluconate aldolase/(4S)-4-hydroxy-2-oxoglutarate aldolase
MNPMFCPDLQKRISVSGVVAVLSIEKPEHAVPLANALIEGGVDCIELTLRTPLAMDAARAILAHCPRMTLGIGTILTVEQVRQVQEMGAAFGVSPGTNQNVLRAAASCGLSFAPGICTPSDVEAALEMNCRLLKFFPCEASGGLAYLRNIAAPFAHLGVKYIPLGGVDAANASEYLADPLVAAIGGSWLAPKELITSENWTAVTANAKQASEIARAHRKGG